MTDRWEFVITADAEVIPGPEDDNEEDEVDEQ